MTQAVVYDPNRNDLFTATKGRGAFLNDKLDLVQAEAIADLIDSVSEHAARAATRSLQGEFSSLQSTIPQITSSETESYP